MSYIRIKQLVNMRNIVQLVFEIGTCRIACVFKEQVGRYTALLKLLHRTDRHFRKLRSHRLLVVCLQLTRTFLQRVRHNYPAGAVIYRSACAAARFPHQEIVHSRKRKHVHTSCVLCSEQTQKRRLTLK